MKLTDEDVNKMRAALIDASPLSDRMKEIVKSQYEVSIVHRDVVQELARVVGSDYGTYAESRLTSILDLLGEK